MGALVRLGARWGRGGGAVGGGTAAEEAGWGWGGDAYEGLGVVTRRRQKNPSNNQEPN